MMKVLVPSTGNLYIYEDENFINLFEGSSRPLHGESIYLQMARNWSAYEAAKGSRPLHGESIYLRKEQNILEKKFKFSSPPRGIYISTASWTVKDTG